MSMTAVALEAQGLTKRFGAHTAVHELTFTVGQGDILGLLGPNGAGKTTTIRLLTTMLSPTSGDFSVAGVRSNRPTEIRRRIGVLPESASYPGQQTTKEYLCFHARLFGLSRPAAEQMADRLLIEVNLDQRGSSRIATLSRGMRQRLGIARALVNDPAVVFLDEPTLGLDPAGQRKVLTILRDISLRRGATIVLSTHTLTDVEEVCSRVLILDKGRVLTSGTVSEVTRAVAHRRTGHLRVPAELAVRAHQALATVDGLTIDVTGDSSDLFTITSNGAGGPAGALLNAALIAVLHADVPVLSFEVEGARLTDAFLEMTTTGA
ncbi:MAG: transporter related protein [Frankiales bacterium]|nr:transporter related protein [Frankiales bacterium]